MESKREILEDTFYAIIDKVLIILSPIRIFNRDIVAYI